MPYLLFLKMQQNLKVSSAAKYRWRLKGHRFQNILSGTLSECQTVWIKIRTDVLSVLIVVLTVLQML